MIVNGKPVKWTAVPECGWQTFGEIKLPAQENYKISITWKGNKLSQLFYRKQLYNYERFVVDSKILSGFELYDPQKVFTEPSTGKNFLSESSNRKEGIRLFL